MGEVERHCLGKPTDPGRSGSDNRRFVEAGFWMVRTGTPWRSIRAFLRQLEHCFSSVTATGSKPGFSSGFSRPVRTLRTWNTPWSTPPSSRSTATDRAQKGDPEPGHRPFQRRHDDQDSGADRCARQSRPLRSPARPSLRYRRGVAPLIDGLAFGGFIADKAFDSNSIIAELNERGAKIVISQHPRRTLPLPIDAELYKWRHLIENFFCKLKEFKRIAMRADKTDQSFAANIHLAAAVINSR